MAKIVDKYLIDVRAIGAKEAGDDLKKPKKGADDLLKSLTKMVAGIVTAQAAFSGLRRSLELRGQFEGVESGFNNLTSSAGFSTNTLGKLREALNGTTSDLNIMTQANNAMLLGIFDSEDQMANLFDAAQRLGEAMGKDTLTSITSLTTGLGRQSKLVLDNLGIMFEVNDAYDEYAKVLEKTSGTLTEGERKQAFINKAISEAERLVSNLGPEQETLKRALDRTNASFENFGVVVGEAFAPAAIVASNIIQGFIKTLDVDRVERLAFSIGLTTSAFIVYKTAVRAAAIETTIFQAILAKTGWGTIIAGAGLAVYALMELFDAFENEESLSTTRLQLLKKQEEASRALTAEQEKSVLSLQNKLDQLGAVNDLDKMRLALGHEASDQEKELMANIISKSNALQYEVDLKKINISLMEKEMILMDDISQRRYNLQILSATNNDQANTEIFQMNQQIKLMEDLRAVGVGLNLNKLQSNALSEDEIHSLMMQLDMGAQWTEMKQSQLELIIREYLLRTQSAEAEEDYATDAIRHGAQIISSMSKVIGVNKKNQILAAKMAAIATGVNAFAAANAAMKSASEVPVIGWLLGPAAYASTLATGLIAAYTAHQKAGEIASAEQGGLIGGRRHSQGGTLIEAERGEFIMSRNAVSSVGVENLNKMNQGSSNSGGTTVVNISGGLISPDFVENDLAEAVREGIRRGADFGLIPHHHFGSYFLGQEVH